VAIGTKFVELGRTPSDSTKFYAPHRQALFDKRLKNHSPEGFEMAYRNLLPGNWDDAHISSRSWMSVAIVYNTGFNPSGSYSIFLDKKGFPEIFFRKALGV